MKNLSSYGKRQIACGNRFKAYLPSLIMSPERHQHLVLDSTIRELVSAASPAMFDRLLVVSGRAR